MHRFRVPGDQGMPVLEILPLGDQAVGAGAWQPGEFFHLLPGEHDAIGHLALAPRIELTAARLEIEPAAGDRGIGHLRRVPVLELEKATLAAAVAQRFPLLAGHLIKGFPFPER